MLNTYRKIAFRNLSEHCGLSSPKPQLSKFDLNSEAEMLMTDFTKKKPTTANESISVSDALELMRVNQIHALMIIGYNGEFVGVIAAMDLMGSKPMIYANEAGVSHADVLVKHIMLPKHKLKAVLREDIEKSTIGDVMQTLSSLHEQHILVVDGENEKMQISGLFSTSDFKRALGIAFDPPVFAHTFYDLERVINEHKEVM